MVRLASQKLNEGPIKSIVREILTHHSDGEVDENELLREIIRWQKLDLKKAKDVFNAMKLLGLDVCKEGELRYSIPKFAFMRNYFTEAELKQFQDKAKRPGKRR